MKANDSEMNKVVLRELYINVRACNAELKHRKLKRLLENARNRMSIELRKEIDALTKIMDEGR